MLSTNKIQTPRIQTPRIQTPNKKLWMWLGPTLAVIIIAILIIFIGWLI